MKIIHWEASYFKHSINIQAAAWNYKSLIASGICWKHIKSESQKSYSVRKNKKQCLQFFFSQARTLILYAKFICPGLVIKAWENLTARLEKFERGSTAQTDIDFEPEKW